MRSTFLLLPAGGMLLLNILDKMVISWPSQSHFEISTDDSVENVTGETMEYSSPVPLATVTCLVRVTVAKYVAVEIGSRFTKSPRRPPTMYSNQYATFTTQVEI